MKKLVMMCGLPRSGKTTFRNMLKEEVKDIFVISADELRYLIYGQRYFDGGEDFVWSTRDKIFKYMLIQSKTILIDETNTSIKRRKAIIELAKQFKYKVICVYVNTPLNICEGRARKDDNDLRVVMDRMSKYFQVPLKAEGVDVVTIEGNIEEEHIELMWKAIIKGLGKELKEDAEEDANAK